MEQPNYRLNKDYRFDVQLEEGIVSETWFAEMSSRGDRFEVKWDKRALETGNLYVEYEDCHTGDGIFVPSGISRSEADCWVFVFEDPPGWCVLIEIERLKKWARMAIRGELKSEQRYGSCPTKGALVPLEWLFPKLFERSV